MSIKLNEARQKKADELGLPLKYNVEHSYILNSSGRIITQGCTDGTALKKIAESANRVLQLEQAVEELMDALREITKCEGAYNPDRLKHAENCMNSMCKVAREALEQTEADHE